MVRLACLNCGSGRVVAEIEGTPSDDLDGFWCAQCSLPVEAEPRGWLRRGWARLGWLARKFWIWLYLG